MQFEQMLANYLIPFMFVWGGLLVLLVIHIGWINSRWKLTEWPVALYYVAISDRKTRNDFWHLVINSMIVVAIAILIYRVLSS